MLDKILKKYGLEMPYLKTEDSSYIATFLDEQLYPSSACLSYVGRGITNISDIEADHKEIKLLDISENPLNSIEGIKKFENLRILIARKCEITFIPPEMEYIDRLFHINLAENKLSANQVGHFNEGVLFLDISRNRIDEWPPSIEELSHLRFLYISGNRVSSIITTVQKLSVLMADHNNIETIRFESGARLKKVNLSCNRLTSLNDAIGGLQKLRILDLSNNRIECLTDEFCTLHSLEKLNIGHNPIKQLPEQFGRLIHLDSLTIDHTHLNQLPTTFRELNLSTFVANNNTFKTFPEELIDIRTLSKVILRKCRIRSGLPPEIRKLSSLSELDVSINYLTSISLSELPASLIILRAKSNKIADISGGNKSLRLEELDLQTNKLTEIPSEISLLPSLKILNLSGNNIKEIPDELFNLITLERLNLSNNALSMLPASIVHLVNLIDLNLYGNKLRMLPVEIGNLINLRSLNLVGNNIDELPATLGNLARLRNLAVRRNNLSSVPLELVNLYNLETFNVDENPMERMPEIKGMGLADVFSWLKKVGSGDSVLYTVQLDDAVRLPFKQFLLLFRDFVQLTKNREFEYSITDIPVGLSIELKVTGGCDLQEINNYFVEYAEYLKEATKEWHLNIENSACPTMLSLSRLVLSMRNSVKFLYSAFRISMVSENDRIIDANGASGQLVAVKLEYLEKRIEELTCDRNMLYELLKDAINTPSLQIANQVITGGEQQFADGIVNAAQKYSGGLT